MHAKLLTSKRSSKIERVQALSERRRSGGAESKVEEDERENPKQIASHSKDVSSTLATPHYSHVNYARYPHLQWYGEEKYFTGERLLRYNARSFLSCAISHLPFRVPEVLVVYNSEVLRNQFQAVRTQGQKQIK